MRKKSKAIHVQLSPGLVASTTSSQETEWVFCGAQNAHTHIYLLTYLLFPDPHGDLSRHYYRVSRLSRHRSRISHIWTDCRRADLSSKLRSFADSNMASAHSWAIQPCCCGDWPNSRSIWRRRFSGRVARRRHIIRAAGRPARSIAHGDARASLRRCLTQRYWIVAATNTNLSRRYKYLSECELSRLCRHIGQWSTGSLWISPMARRLMARL